jgi:anhydro-N-acetylmuramic acid kinase
MNESIPTYIKPMNIIGVMSGTSLDGVDIAHCTFSKDHDRYSFQINACETIPYSVDWHKLLTELPKSSAEQYAYIHVKYGRLLGELVKYFISKFILPVDYIASHGHTIFHQPGRGFTSQIGDGAAMAATTGIPVICDFRSSDVAYSGQGAPLVPAGDELLFHEYDYCLNLGGFGNISYRQSVERIAFDICPVNILLNYLAAKKGLDFDEGGQLASSGKIDIQLLKKLNKLQYYHAPPPKTLGREWLENELLPLVSTSSSIEDQLRTIVEHISIQVNNAIADKTGKRMLVTGGGAKNSFLIQQIEFQTGIQIIIPSEQLIDYKEALIFAFLGYLRVNHQPNCLSSVTGASKNACGGALYIP